MHGGTHAHATDLKRLDATAFAFRGYNVTNLGRTDELLAHRIYGPLVEAHLREAARSPATCSRSASICCTSPRADRIDAGDLRAATWP